MMLNGSGLPDPTAYKAMAEREIKMDWMTGEVLRHEETGKVFVCVKAFEDSPRPYAVCFQLYDGRIDSDNAVAVKLGQGEYMYGEVTRLFYVNDHTKDVERYKVVRTLQEAELTQILNFIGYGLSVPYKVKEQLKAEEAAEETKPAKIGCEWLKTAIDMLGVQQAEITRRTGLSHSAISNMIYGKSGNPKQETLEKIFRAMFEIVTERAVYAANTQKIIKADEIPAVIEKPVKSAVDASEVEALKIEVARWKERAEIFEMLWREGRA